MKKITSEKSKRKKALKRRNKILMWSLISVSVLLLCFLISYFSRPDSSYGYYGSSVDTTAMGVMSEKDRINAQITAKNKNYRNNWYNYISVDRKFAYYGIGGIEDLKIIAANKTDYLINEVTVNVCYVIDNGTCYKTEQVTVYNIPPNSSSSVSAPDSPRGKEVSLEIVGVYSDKMNFLYTPSIVTNGVDDPYFEKK